MLGPAALLGALAVGARAIYPRLLERRASRRRAVGADGLIVGAAPVSHQRTNAPAVLLLHGGGDTPQVVADLAASLYEAGFSTSAPLLPGHGRTLATLRTVSAASLQEFAQQQYDALRATHEQVAVVGLSIGGALAVDLSVKRDDIAALVLLAPYLGMPRGVQALARTASFWGWALPYLPSLGSRSILDPVAAEKALGHGIITPRSLAAFHDIVLAANEALPLVRVPTLVVHSRGDNRIPSPVAERAFERLGAAEKRLVWTEGAAHVITVDYGRERVFELCADWLTRHVRDAGAADVSAAPPEPG